MEILVSQLPWYFTEKQGLVSASLGKKFGGLPFRIYFIEDVWELNALRPAAAIKAL